MFALYMYHMKENTIHRENILPSFQIQCYLSEITGLRTKQREGVALKDSDFLLLFRSHAYDLLR